MTERVYGLDRGIHEGDVRDKPEHDIKKSNPDNDIKNNPEHDIKKKQIEHDIKKYKFGSN